MYSFKVDGLDRQPLGHTIAQWRTWLIGLLLMALVVGFICLQAYVVIPRLERRRERRRGNGLQTDSQQQGPAETSKRSAKTGTPVAVYYLSADDPAEALSSAAAGVVAELECEAIDHTLASAVHGAAGPGIDLGSEAQFDPSAYERCGQPRPSEMPSASFLLANRRL